MTPLTSTALVGVTCVRYATCIPDKVSHGMESLSGFIPLQVEVEPSIIVHGGAGQILDSRKKSAQSIVTDAAKIGHRVLQEV